MTFTVATYDIESGKYFHWWTNFMLEACYQQASFNVQDVLDHHNSKAILNPSDYRIGDHLDFETEHDFTAFVLRWS